MSSCLGAWTNSFRVFVTLVVLVVSYNETGAVELVQKSIDLYENRNGDFRVREKGYEVAHRQVLNHDRRQAREEESPRLMTL